MCSTVALHKKIIAFVIACLIHLFTLFQGFQYLIIHFSRLHYFLCFHIYVICYCSFVAYSVRCLCTVPYYRACKSQIYNFVPYLRKLAVYFRFKRLLSGKGRITPPLPESVLKRFILPFQSFLLFHLLFYPHNCRMIGNLHFL